MAWLLLMVLIMAGAAAGRRMPFPESVIWCVLGCVVAFLPGFPALGFDPRIALYVIVPPLVYSSAVELPWPEFRANLRPIGMLAIGLVAATTAATAAIAHTALHMAWPMAIVLGAVTAPTDPVAASAIASRIGIPHRLVAILEGEGLVNDAVSLTVFRIALGVAAGGAFSLASSVGRFLLILIGEPLYGILLGIAIAWMRKHIEDPRIEVAVSLVTPFAAYLLPEHLGGSGILATVATGMYIGERRSTLVRSGTRVQAYSFWETLIFLLNGSLFLVAGTELARLVMGRPEQQSLIWPAVEIGCAVAGARVAWCATVWLGLRRVRRWRGGPRVEMPGRHMAIIGWAGMRGPISLAAALSIPALAGGSGHGDQQTVFLVTSVVILMTLVIQGAALTPMVRLLRVDRDARAEDAKVDDEVKLGRAEATQAALGRIEALRQSGAVTEAAAEKLRRLYADETAALRSAESGVAPVMGQLISAERAKILGLREERRISDYALGRLEHDLDLREILLG